MVSTEVIGDSGIGKTSSIVQLADELGLNFVKLNLAQIEEIGDLVGFPIRQFQMNEGKNIEWVNLNYFFDFRFSKISMIAPINAPKASPQAIDF
jgi:midasin (ATPase involved in ribosome maturation)